MCRSHISGVVSARLVHFEWTSSNIIKWQRRLFVIWRWIVPVNSMAIGIPINLITAKLEFLVTCTALWSWLGASWRKCKKSGASSCDAYSSFATILNFLLLRISRVRLVEAEADAWYERIGERSPTCVCDTQKCNQWQQAGRTLLAILRQDQDLLLAAHCSWHKGNYSLDGTLHGCLDDGMTAATKENLLH